MYRIRMTQRALRIMEAELARYPDDETGGILLGYIREKDIWVVEAIDGGMAAVRKPHTFRYDTAYVTHVANLLAVGYTPPLEMVGLWHKHTQDLPDRYPFSAADEELHRQLLQITGKAGVSILFQKNMAGEYTMRTYQILPSGRGEEIPCQIEK